ncbi:hypothetical protein B0H10DRAFT_2195093 [Mycena sp. CBHHK59/15]|nr:hypothetical protein B0H10DRAFT_2199681 [Mycena sp. CBHHK59/15]KAJ6586636.1 hypothetical protein B0H10DRAFT_2197980 [Mycena sp. CBHHK59/15]KAJ6586776.1 hypothetical protein B0H10DRAFT_2197928 [Mycena sp. CBHHK59/15]KAJ6605715.1 hypothetical protein B0H10DRAFT_2195445 [Mycena sp. CBHHK59/15]KAJ6607123.1 hypothetical protein B0H10DRAFT_2195093 [Mycena sp. CBHHK59/15]
MKHPRGSDSKKAVEPSNARTALLKTILMSRTVLPAPAARPRSSDNSNSSRSDTISSPSSGLMKHSEKGHRKRSQEFIIPSTSSEPRSVGESGIPSTYIPTNSINASTQKEDGSTNQPEGDLYSDNADYLELNDQELWDMFMNPTSNCDK